jgi:dolichol-phosphate mannosyltransferase
VVKLSRNFGHQIAITAGLDHARGDAAVVIDADLQDPPELIGRLVAQWRAGFDVVYGVRRLRRGERAWKRLSASVFYRVMDQLTGFSIPVDAGDFRLMSRRALDELCRMREKDRYVRGLVSWIGFPQTGVPYERDERFAGDTKYPLSKRVRFAADAIASFSMAPLKLATWLGFGTAAVALGVLGLALAGRMAPAWAPLLAAVLLLGAVQLICLGILGEYLGRIFNEIKPRPNYVVEERLGGESEGAARATASPYPSAGPAASGR